MMWRLVGWVEYGRVFPREHTVTTDTTKNRKNPNLLVFGAVSPGDKKKNTTVEKCHFRQQEEEESQNKNATKRNKYLPS
jgi:hypothetical protein